MPHSRIAVLILLAVSTPWSEADDLLYRYEGDVLPYDPSAGWLNGLCEDPCSESLRDGHLVLEWWRATDLVNYHHWIARPPDLPPRSLWVEWRFRSNHPIGPYFYTCDGNFSVKYGGAQEVVFMYGNAALSFSAGQTVLGLALDEFHTFRFESLDGIHYHVSVDGKVFITDSENRPNGYHSLQFGGDGGCGGDEIPNMRNEWDFVRYGTISSGEHIVASDPPAGFLDSRVYPTLDRFTVTFDSPNYVYVYEIAVEVILSGGRPSLDPPQVIQTRRLDNGPPDVVEIVLDRPIPPGAQARFTFDDGTVINTVSYTYKHGDADADNDWDLADFAALQACFGAEAEAGNRPWPCAAFAPLILSDAP